MLVRGQKRIIYTFVPIIGLLLLVVIFYTRHLVVNQSVFQLPTKEWSSIWNPSHKQSAQEPVPKSPKLPTDYSFDRVDVSSTHNEVFSVSTRDERYFKLDFGGHKAINPNIVPHPTLADTWIMVAMKGKSQLKGSSWYAELPNHPTNWCYSRGPHCLGELDFFDSNIGPHDARLFYGPQAPYIIYGSNSAYTCFGQWVQDFRILVDWGKEQNSVAQFRMPTDLQRPPPYYPIEKNWFFFWDLGGQLYAHYDVFPKRVFAKVEFDGSVGPDLAPLTAANDQLCIDKYMPPVAKQLESIHQATNSLSITLCNRSDPTCQPTDSNTKILTIFQHKSYYDFHSVYEPYIMLFDQSAPFGIHAMSQKPIWIHGRGKPGEKRPNNINLKESTEWHQTEMFYITSISWKKAGQRYHGYLDDEMFVAFGIEDQDTATIDVVAGDLLRDLGGCEGLAVGEDGFGEGF